MDLELLKNNGTLYKEYHENYMKNNNGTTVVEIFLVILPSFAQTFLMINLSLIIPKLNENLIKKYLLELCIIVIPIILNVTILESKMFELNMALICVVSIMVWQQLWPRKHLTPFIQIPTKKLEYLNISRSVINIITAVCILAVDFTIFPKKFAKTENFGFGLMDVGVGLFVFSNGIISYNVKYINNKLNILFVNNLPLIVLGVSRFAVIKQIDYQVHTSEYGVHWNFFITLAVTKFFGNAIIILAKNNQTIIKYLAIGILSAHQMLLQIGLGNFVMNENIKRDNFITANREGIISIPGYVALYLCSIYIGNLIKSNKEISKPRDFIAGPIKLAILSVIFWKLIYVCDKLFGVSRRLGNMGYVVWILSIGTTMTCLFGLLEIFHYYVTFEKPTSTGDETETKYKSTSHLDSYIPIILNAINFNGLGFFLLANIFTGLVNMIFKTLLMSTEASLLVLIGYMSVLCGITTFLYVNKVKLKIW